MTAPRSGQAWWADTLAKRLFVLMWVALVGSHLLAFSVVTWDWRPAHQGAAGPRPGELSRPDDGRLGLPPMPSLPPTPGLPDMRGAPAQDPASPGAGGPRRPVLSTPQLVLDYGLRLLVIAAAAWWGSRWLARPVRRLVQAAGTLGAGLGAQQSHRPLDEHSGTVEVREAAAVFNRMAEQLRRQFQQRELLMAAVSHDLRTPLTRLRLRLETLDLPPEQFDRSVADIQELNALIDQALSVFRSQSVPEPAQRLDLAAQLQSMADDRAEQGQPVVCAALPQSAPVLAPPQGLRRVLDNLIGNALRYGERAKLSLQAEGGGWLVCVDDEGPGIAEDQLDAVLQPFYRLESSRNRGSGGTGLGLYIAAELTAGMGGRLRLANRAGRGLRATVWLPRSDPA